MREWRPIPGWPGYRVSNDGCVETCKTNGGLLSENWKPKKSSVDEDGYLRLKLTHKSRTVFTGVHDLVLIAFGPPRPPGDSMCCHANGQRQDNRIDNLRWGFADDNAADRDAHGATARFERNGNAKLTWERVFAIREMVASGRSYNSVAKEFGVSKKCVLNIVHGRTWDERKAMPKT